MFEFRLGDSKPIKWSSKYKILFFIMWDIKAAALLQTCVHTASLSSTSASWASRRRRACSFPVPAAQCSALRPICIEAERKISWPSSPHSAYTAKLGNTNKSFSFKDTYSLSLLLTFSTADILVYKSRDNTDVTNCITDGYSIKSFNEPSQKLHMYSIRDLVLACLHAMLLVLCTLFFR